MTKGVGMVGGSICGEGKSWLLLTGAGISSSEVRLGESNDGVEDDVGK